MNLYYSPYLLEFNKFFKASHSSVVNGALLALELEDGSLGYSCLQSWPHLGDLNIQTMFLNYQKNIVDPILQNSILMAVKDAKARAIHKSLWDKDLQIENHYLIHDILKLSDKEIMDIAEFGFKTLKVKISKNARMDLIHLQNLVYDLSDSLNYRLDFNAQLNSYEFKELTDLLEPILDRIDCMEDPFSDNLFLWNDYIQKGYSFASDFITLNPAELNCSLVFKPARDSLLTLKDCSNKILVTSYMDHPVGQCHAAISSQDIDRDSLLGLGCASHLVFEKNEYSERLQLKNSIFKEQDGLGIGFDDLLMKESWKKLNVY